MQTTFRGVWVGRDALCRSYNEFLWVYDQRGVTFPYEKSPSPGNGCRILSVTGRRPDWTLRLLCYLRPEGSRPARSFEMRQVIHLTDHGQKLQVRTEAVLDQPARVDELRYCRKLTDPEPFLQCISEKTGAVIPCPP